MIIDLTYPIHNGMFKYPSDIEPEINIKKAESKTEHEVILDASGFGSGAGVATTTYKSGHTQLKIRNHHGTHIDAPAHKLSYGKTITDYEISKFINIGKLIDLTKTDLLQRKQRQIRLEDIKEQIDQSNKFRALIFYTGFCDEIAKNEGKLKSDVKTEFEKTFPYLSINAAKYIAKNSNGLNIIGIDSFAVDPAGSNSEIHRIFFEKQILALETLVNLNELKIRKGIFELNCVPLHYSKADAAQTRAYAIPK